MKTFRELYIRLNGYSIENLIEKLTAHCNGMWTHVVSREMLQDLSGLPSYCFERKKGDGIPSAALYLFNKDSNTWYIANIIPTDLSELTHDQYNKILLNFQEFVVEPAIKASKIDIEVTKDQISIADLAGEEVEKSLINFSTYANKSTGSSNSFDRKRWFKFLVLANQSGVILSSDIIVKTLIELGWSEERAYELGIEFNFANDLLSYIKE
jgi:hypothetical protein